MKWLERKPESYDRGIRYLTLGRIITIRRNLVERYVRKGMNVLEIGCGTGELACLMAQKGAKVRAVDIVPAMLAVAKDRVERENLSELVKLERRSATAIDELGPSNKFDLIVASLVLSELSLNEQKMVIRGCNDLLKAGGALILVDEVRPHGVIKRLGYLLARIPLALVTFLMTRTSTRALHDVGSLLQQQGFKLDEVDVHLGGSLCMFISKPSLTLNYDDAVQTVPQITSGTFIRNFLVDIWTLFFRIVPPYPKVMPGLYRIGAPNKGSPLLVSGNFDLTIRKLLRAVNEKLDAWLLVVDSAGINVWCAAGGGFFTAEKVISAFKANRVKEFVSHKMMILPQLSAVGVSGWRIRERTGWDVIWGPVDAEDILEFTKIDNQKTDRMRTVGFPVKNRLEMVSGTFGLYGLIILVPIAIFWRHLFWPAFASLAGLSYFYALVLPWLPGVDGLWKSIPFTLISLTGLILFTVIIDPVSAESFYNRAFGIVALSIFVSGEFQGMSPLMRGEQANWIPEAAIGVFMAVVYWLTPFVLGWR
jgi:ubiquinone/menaquinone biosynthesis C-methylase UbiE